VWPSRWPTAKPWNEVRKKLRASFEMLRILVRLS
jgi:hypothetical protein